MGRLFTLLSTLSLLLFLAVDCRPMIDNNAFLLLPLDGVGKDEGDDSVGTSS
ncbi:hypothetical protein QJS10_CPA06g00932 [Acorus calamus]|uniref:Uncharacterized protein n=1 Tax=Acorus calamus TaxID=4465 RepID=A0AAV9EME0_ACOCL|nr:hypothetical protein QJS10_CPA06g00932 [Acorus calamus]